SRVWARCSTMPGCGNRCRPPRSPMPMPPAAPSRSDAPCSRSTSSHDCPARRGSSPARRWPHEHRHRRASSPPCVSPSLRGRRQRLRPAAPPGRIRDTCRCRGSRGAGADRRGLALRLSPLLGLIVSAVLVWWGIEAGVLTSLESLRAFITALGAWGPLAFLVITVALVVFPVIPGGLTVIAAPVLFGAVEGIALAYLAVCTGLLLNFT